MIDQNWNKPRFSRPVLLKPVFSILGYQTTTLKIYYTARIIQVKFQETQTLCFDTCMQTR